MAHRQSSAESVGLDQLCVNQSVGAEKNVSIRAMGILYELMARHSSPLLQSASGLYFPMEALLPPKPPGPDPVAEVTVSPPELLPWLLLL